MAEAKRMTKSVAGLHGADKSVLRKEPARRATRTKQPCDKVDGNLDRDKILDQFNVPEKIRPFVVIRPHGPDMLDASQAAARLGVSERTVHEWVKKGILLGWKMLILKIPAEQIAGPGKIVPGVAEVAEIIGDHGLAWSFLSQEWPFEHEVVRPMDKLKDGKIQEVLDTAPSFGFAFT